MKRCPSPVVALLVLLAAATPASANLVANWSFDEGQGQTALDDIGGFDGTLEGDSVLVGSGGVSGGFLDNGDTGFVNAGANLEFLGLESFSIQMWIRTSATTFASLLSRHVMGYQNGYGIGLETNGSFYVYQSDNPSHSSGAAGLRDGAWHQIVVVRDSFRSQLRLYVDGARAPLPTSAGGLGHINATPASLLIGGVTSGGTPTHTYDGMVDEVRIWDSALSDADVELLHAYPESLNTVLCGDHNRSRSLTASDAQAILRVGVEAIDGLDCVVNANGTGGITATDALLVLRGSVGQAVVFQCPICVASDIVGLRVEAPCTNGGNPVCTSSNAFSESVTMGGESGVTYDVTLRIRGVVEEKTYTGGLPSGRFLTGGDPAADGYNVTKLEVSEPAGTYHLNAGTSGVERVWELDETATIPIRAGATVTLSVLPLDGLQIANNDGTGQPVIPSGLPPAPDPFPGQFVQLDVVATSELD
jgi:hypothetical protein